MHFDRGLSARRMLLFGAPLVALLVVVATPQLAGHRLSQAWSALTGASPGWLWLSLAAFLASTLFSVLSLRTALGAAGARLTRVDAAARFGVGSLVNSFAPGSAGDAVRIALLAQRVEGPNRIWTTTGATAAVAVLRGVSFAALVVAAAVVGALPYWPVAVLAGGAAAAGAAGWALRRRIREGRVRRFLDGFTVLERNPRAAAIVFGWATASQAARLAAAAAVAAALSVPHPLTAALVIVPALQLATILPATPGNVITSGAVALALQTRGVGVGQALATGIAYHAAETIVGLTFGIAGTLMVIEVPPLARRLAVATGAVVLAVGLGATVLTLV